MNLASKKYQLKALISDFLEGNCSVEKLDEFVWQIIEYFTVTPKGKLPGKMLSEKTFWFVIWEVQHLIGEADEDDLIRFELEKCVNYLNEEMELPTGSIGERPV